jgi:hypothetical protein
LTNRLFTTSTHKATSGNDGPQEKYDLPLSLLGHSRKDLKICHQYKTYEYYQKQKEGKKQIHLKLSITKPHMYFII